MAHVEEGSDAAASGEPEFVKRPSPKLDRVSKQPPEVKRMLLAQLRDLLRRGEVPETEFSLIRPDSGRDVPRKPGPSSPDRDREGPP